MITRVKLLRKRFLIESSKTMWLWWSCDISYFIANSVIFKILADTLPMSHESIQNITQSLRDTLGKLGNLTRHCCICVRKVCGTASVVKHSGHPLRKWISSVGSAKFCGPCQVAEGVNSRWRQRSTSVRTQAWGVVGRSKSRRTPVSLPHPLPVLCVCFRDGRAV